MPIEHIDVGELMNACFLLLVALPVALYIVIGSVLDWREDRMIQAQSKAGTRRRTERRDSQTTH